MLSGRTAINRITAIYALMILLFINVESVFGFRCHIDPDTEIGPVEKHIISHLSLPLEKQLDINALEEYTKAVAGSPYEYEISELLKTYCGLDAVRFFAYDTMNLQDSTTRALTWLRQTKKELKSFLTAASISDATRLPLGAITSIRNGIRSLMYVYEAERLQDIDTLVDGVGYHDAPIILGMIMRTIEEYANYRMIPHPAHVLIDVYEDWLTQCSAVVLASPNCFSPYDYKVNDNSNSPCSYLMRSIARTFISGLFPELKSDNDDNIVHAYAEAYKDDPDPPLDRKLHEMLLMMGNTHPNALSPCKLTKHPYFQGLQNKLFRIPAQLFGSKVKIARIEEDYVPDIPDSWSEGIFNEFETITLDLYSNELVYVARTHAFFQPVQSIYIGDKDGFKESPNLLQPYFVGQSTPKGDYVTVYKMPEDRGSLQDYTMMNIRDYIMDQGLTLRNFANTMDFLINTMTDSQTPGVVNFDFSPFVTNVLLRTGTLLESEKSPENLIVALNHTFFPQLLNRHCSAPNDAAAPQKLGACIADLYLELRGFQSACPFIKYEMETYSNDITDATLTSTFKTFSEHATPAELRLITILYTAGLSSSLSSLLDQLAIHGKDLNTVLPSPNVPPIFRMKCMYYDFLGSRHIEAGLRAFSEETKIVHGASFVNSAEHAAQLIKTLEEVPSITSVKLAVMFGSIITVLTERNEELETKNSIGFLPLLYIQYKDLFDRGLSVFNQAKQAVMGIFADESFVLRHGRKSHDLASRLTLGFNYRPATTNFMKVLPNGFDTDTDSMNVVTLGEVAELAKPQLKPADINWFLKTRLNIQSDSNLLEITLQHLNALARPTFEDIESKKYPLISTLMGVFPNVPNTGFHARGEDDECNICFDDTNDRQFFKQKCGHTFHSDCLYEWTTRSATCPYCREPSIDVLVDQLLEKTRAYSART